MLKTITLHTINEIFKEADSPLSAQEKMTYISCLIHHFKNLEPSEKNAMQFSVGKDAASFDRYSATYHSLCLAGLIGIEKDEIIFQNTWGQHIDRSVLTSESDSKSPINEIGNYANELRQTTSISEFIMRTYKLKGSEYVTALEDFVEEQAATKRVYNSFRDVLGHFKNWMKYSKKGEISELE